MKNTLLILALSIFYIGGLDAARTIAYASTPPIIDGEIDPVWSSSMADVHSIEIEVLAPQTNNPAGRWRGLFDNDFFYFLFEINDANRWGNPANGNYWNGDAVELCLKTSIPEQKQLGFGYVSNGTPRRYGDYLVGGEAQMKDVTTTYLGIPGYILEIKIPKQDLDLLPFTLGTELFMEVCVNQTNNTSSRQAQLACFVNNANHYNSFANYTAVLLTNFNQPTIRALNEKTTICSNGSDFASLVLDAIVPEGSAVAYQWKRNGANYTAAGATSNNIRPTAAGNYTCEVDVTLEGLTTKHQSNSISILANKTCSDFKTALPIFVVNTNGQGFPANSAKDKRECDVKVIWNGENSYNNLTDMAGNETVHYDRKAIMNYRGSTSRTFAKKPYAFAAGKKDLIDGVVDKANYPMLGNPSEKDWILYAAYADKSMIRNKLAMELYKDMGYYASSMRYVDLFIDGDYKGVYIFMEKYERGEERLNVTKDFETALPEDIGYVYKFDKIAYDDPSTWVRNEDYCGGPCGDGGCGYGKPIRTEDRQGYELVYPQTDVVNYSQKKAYIVNFISEFEKDLNAASNDDDFANIFKTYIDLKSFVDYFIMAEVARNTDSYRISMFFTKDAGGKIKCTPVWDFEMGYGNSRTHGGYTTSIWQYSYNGSEPENNLVNGMNEPHFPIPFWWKKLMTSSCFKSVLRTRWEELRQNVFSSNNIMFKIDASAAILSADIDGVSNTSPMGRNKDRWSWTTINACATLYSTCPWMVINWPANYSGVANPAGKTTSFSTQEVPLLKAWIQNRINWIDQTVMNNSFAPLLNDSGIKTCCQEVDNGIGVDVKESLLMHDIQIVNDDNSITVFSLNKEPISSIQIYNVNGVLLYEKQSVNNAYVEINEDFNQKILIVKVQTTTQIKTQMLVF